MAASIERDRDLVKLIFEEGVTVPELMCGDAGGFSVQPTASLLIRRAQTLREIHRDLDPDELATAWTASISSNWCAGAGPSRPTRWQSA